MTATPDAPVALVPDIDDDATRREFLVGSAALALLLAACGTSDDTTADTDAPQTRSVSTAQGDVDIPADAQRVVAMYVTDLDYALVLDLPVVGAGTAQGEGSSFASYQPAERLTDVEPLTTYPEADYEQIATVRPDVLIDSRPYDKTDYRLLTEIAPTVNFSDQVFGADSSDPDWRRALRYLADAFGRSDEAEGYIGMFDDRVADLRERLVGAIGTGTFAVTTPYDGDLYVQTSTDIHLPRTLVDDLGFTLPQQVVDLGGGEVEVVVSPESYDLLDVDWLFVLTYPDANGERDLSLVESVASSPLWQQLPAVQTGRLVFVDSEVAFPSPLGVTAFVDAVEEAILP